MSENTQEFTEDSRLDRLRSVVESGAFKQAGRMLNALSSGEIAHLLESVPPAERRILWDLVDPELDGEILVQVTDEVRADLISQMDRSEILSAAEGLDLDDLADLVQELPTAITNRVMASLDAQHRERLEAVLSYPENTAGHLMNTDTVTVRPEVTLDVVLRYLRQLGDQVPKDTDSLIVVNRLGKYLGVLGLASLVSNDSSSIVAEVMSLNVQPFPATTESREVAKRFEQHDLISAPVIDDNGLLLGRITIDDIVDVIREEGEHQFMGQAGLSEDEDMFAPVMISAKRRTLWLGINLITAIMASWVIGLFEATIDKVVALAVLMPIVASMGGIAGSQTLALTIRGIALGQLSASNSRWLILKELAVGSINSLVWAVLVAFVAGFWFNSLMLAILIAAALSINLVMAAIMGTVLPLLLNRMGIDPALAGSVLLTTVTDIVGFFAFLGLATVFLL
ncbi:MAG: magnesium transporter [Chromatiales bacterium]|jgi:magnesium transporter